MEKLVFVIFAGILLLILIQAYLDAMWCIGLRDDVEADHKKAEVVPANGGNNGGNNPDDGMLG